MAVDVSSVPDTTASLEPLEKIDAYEQWQQAEGAPLVAGFYIEDLNTLELGRWERKAGQAPFVNLEGRAGAKTITASEIAPAGAPAPDRPSNEPMTAFCP